MTAPAPADVPDVDVLVVDNYDSFAYNLVQYVGELAGDVTVRRNDAVDLADVRALDPDAVVVSPGPGRPEDAGVSTALFEAPDLPILGVCLGHQALCAAYGASVERAPAVVHGKPSLVEHDGAGIYRGLPGRLRVGRYHSLAVPRQELPDALAETAWTVVEEQAPGTPEASDADGASVDATDDASTDDASTDDADRAATGEADRRAAGDADPYAAGDADPRAAGDADRLAADDADSGVAADATAATERSVLMGVRHRERPHYGVQFHPESILTGAAGSPDAASLALGKRLVARFCELAAAHRDGDGEGDRS